jgi:hypothetical protein
MRNRWDRRSDALLEAVEMIGGAILVVAVAILALRVILAWGAGL